MPHSPEDTRRIASKRRLCWFLAPLLLFLPLLFIPHVMFFGNSDALFYTNILALMTHTLRGGTLLPHWFADANAGFGSPVMMFYAPLSYIITAFVSIPFTLAGMDAGGRLLIGMYASQVFSGWASYRWLRRDFDERTAFTGSLLFVLLPYKFVYIYLHINLAQLWALAFLPLWMMAAQDIPSGNRKAVGWYALAFAAVYYTHTLTLIAFGAVPALHVLWHGRRQLTTNIERLFWAHVLGLGICMAQALPSHFYLPWVHAELFLQGAYSWRNNFFHVDVLLCAYYGIAALLVGVAIRRIPSLRYTVAARQGVFWIGVLAVVLFLTQQVSAWLWDIVTPLQYLQFPAARLHAPALLAAVYLLCLWMSNMDKMKPLGGIAYGKGAFIGLIVVFAVATGQRIVTVYSDPAHGSQTYLGNARAARIISTPVSIYETQWGCIDAGKAFKLYEDKQVPPLVTAAWGKANVAAVQRDERISLRADVQSSYAGIMVRQCYVPLWQAEEAGKPVPLAPAKQNGLLQIVLPKGTHDITLSLATSYWDMLGQSIGVFLLTVSLNLALREKRNKTDTPVAQQQSS